MAMPSQEITKSEFRNNYNIVEITNDIDLIMKTLETFNPNNQVVAFGIKKKSKVTLEDVMLRLDGIETRLDKIETRLDTIEGKLIRNNIN